MIAIVARKGEPTNAPLAGAWQALGLPATVLAPEEARTAGLGPGDVAIIRLDVLPTLDGVENGLSVATTLARHGVRIVNAPAAVLTAHDKLRTAGALAAAGIRQPATGFVTEARELRKLHVPVVVKPRFGSWGADVFRARTRADAAALASTVPRKPWFRKHGALVQELVPPRGFDLRVLVAGGVVVGAIERHAAPGEWRTNSALGGTRSPADPSPLARALGISAVAACGLDIGCADLLPLDGTFVVVEVNGAPDFDELYGETVYEAMATALGLFGKAAVAIGPTADASPAGTAAS